MSKFMFDRPAIGGTIADLADKYSPQRVLAPGLIPTLVPEAREEPVLASEAEVAAAERAAVERAAAQAAAAQAAAAQAEAAKEGTEDTIYTYNGVKSKFDPVTKEFYDITDPSYRVKKLEDFTPPPVGKYRGGTVQAYNMGVMASIADLARHYGMRR